MCACSQKDGQVCNCWEDWSVFQWFYDIQTLFKINPNRFHRGEGSYLSIPPPPTVTTHLEQILAFHTLFPHQFQLCSDTEKALQSWSLLRQTTSKVCSWWVTRHGINTRRTKYSHLCVNISAFGRPISPPCFQDLFYFLCWLPKKSVSVRLPGKLF